MVDYGAGNLHSVLKALAYLGATARVVRSGRDFEGIDRLVLPGVGAFGAAMQRLQEAGLVDPIRAWLRADRPFLGICLGMQLLMESSAESPGTRGLEWVPGTCARFRARRVPQIGWNRIWPVRDDPLLTGVDAGSAVYFLHSYYPVPKDPSVVIAETEYADVRYASIIGRGRWRAVQFHPEKSGPVGLHILRNWLEMA